MITDTSDRGIRRHRHGEKRQRSLTVAHEKYVFADPGADGINGNQWPAYRLAVWRQRLHDEQRTPDQPRVLGRRHDRAEYASQMHRM